MKRFKQAVAAGAFAFAILSASPAAAVTLLIKYVPGTDTRDPFTFNVDSDPTPTSVGGDSFTTAISNGTGQYLGRTESTFYGIGSGGLFDSYFGAQIYTGPTSAPSIFQSGTFAAFFGNDPNQAGSLTISAVGAVPEPATWAMMLLGFGAVGFALRRRRQTTTVRFQTA